MVVHQLIILKNGSKHYFQNDSYHRLNGPAIIWLNGHKEWVQNDERHRLDGPAIEYRDGGKRWYYQGKHIKCQSQEEFERIIKLRLLW